MSAFKMRRVPIEDLRAQDRQAVEPDRLRAAAQIVEGVRVGGETELRRLAREHDDLAPGAKLVLGPEDLRAALRGLPERERALLQRTAARIRDFAEAQRRCLTPMEIEVEGGRAGHRITPMERVGCYAPGGRFPLPSSVLMTATVAKAAGVGEVWVASPRPTPLTLAAAALAGAEGLLPVGGAQAIAALAFGSASPAVDFICGPGNSWVTAAKKCLYGEVGIDMLAGPSELLVIADESADPRWVAADLLAQAEHDEEAQPILISDSGNLLAAVERELEEQLRSLPTASIARVALSRGFFVLAPDLESAARASDRLAPEHLSLALRRPRELPVRQYGALFLGGRSAEVLGDYGAGPNHVLPTGGGARFGAGLSVFSFLRAPTWLEMSAPTDLARDAAELGRMEGLEAHARSADLRA